MDALTETVIWALRCSVVIAAGWFALDAIELIYRAMKDKK